MWDIIVVGGGISGLSAAYQAQKLARSSGRPVSCCLVEASGRLGGKVRSESRDGFLVEGGPDAFVTHKPWALDLIRELGLEPELLPPREEDPELYILDQGRLEAIPEGLRSLVPTLLLPLLRSPLLSWRGKLRMLAEPWIGPGPLQDDSLGRFLRRRIGDEALEQLAEPLLAHIHMADIDQMSLEATYPQLRHLVARRGSLTRGVRAAGKGAPRPRLWTLRGGVGELTEALAESLPRDSIFLGRRALHLAEIDSEAEAGAPRYALELEGGASLTASTVVLALPAFAAAELVHPWAGALCEDLRRIRYVSLATLSLGWEAGDLDPPPGFGFFVPRRQARSILAGTFVSNKYEGRTQNGRKLVRLFLGGPRGEELMDLPDEELIALAEAELETILPSRSAPIFKRLYRWPRGYPQYDMGHRERIAALEEAAPRGLLLAGSAYHGVGLPDCIRSGQQAAEKALELLATHGESPLLARPKELSEGPGTEPS